MNKFALAVGLALAMTGSMAAAATVTIDFDSGLLSGGTYTEDGFTFTSNSPGGAGLASSCPTGSPNSSCLQFGNNEIISVTYSGGNFDVEGFLFNAPGNGGDIVVSSGGPTTSYTETQSGNAMTAVDVMGAFDDVSVFTFQNAANGSGRVDNITFTIASVPLPATGLLIMAAMGGLSALRRRKSTS
ncbi:MAG: VPLPA-CTERM sorting domain-containing protein [Rhodobacteraceae bacterium]|nr:VPLPA-CTERM sorting domain-containing protein [Paracoccaceae bacterium]